VESPEFKSQYLQKKKKKKKEEKERKDGACIHFSI
jgi:hypothetical protein